MQDENKQNQSSDEEVKKIENDNKNAMLIDLLKRITSVYNQVIQGKILDANDIQKIDNVFLSLLILNERNYFENAIQKKELEEDKFKAYIKMRHNFINKQLEAMLKDLESKLIESIKKKNISTDFNK